MGWIRKRKLRRLRVETLEQMLNDARNRAHGAAVAYQTEVKMRALTVAAAEEDFAREIVEVLAERQK